MGRWRSFFPLGLALNLLTLGPGSAFGNPRPVVTEVRVGTDDGTLLVEIVASAPLNYVLVEGSEPFTLTFYLLDTDFGFPPSAREVEEGSLRRVVASVLERAESRVGRLELIFDRKAPYRVRQEGPRLLLHVDAPGGATGIVLGTLPQTTATPSPAQSSSRAASPSVESPTGPPIGSSPAPAPLERGAVPGQSQTGQVPRIHRVGPIEAGPEALVSVEADGPLAYRAFTLTAPPRLVVDFENAAYGLERNTILVGGRLLERIRASRFRVAPTPVVRIVFDLRRLVPYWIEPQDRGVMVHIGTRGPAQRAR